MSAILDLSRRGYRSWPIELLQDEKAHEVDISLNELKMIDIPTQTEQKKIYNRRTFPLEVEVFKATGNKIEVLPESISELAHLKHLLLSGNRISDITPLLTLRHLVQLGISHNEVHSLPLEFTFQRLMSLDLSFNKLCNREETLLAIKSCQSLRHLRLKGNPFCLQNGYFEAIVTHLPQLVTIDEIDAASFEEKKEEINEPCEIHLELEITDVELEINDHTTEDTKHNLRNYYIQFEDFNGSSICSFPVNSQAIVKDTEAQTKNANSKENKSNDLSLQGSCKAHWKLEGTISEADWLQSFHLKLFKESIREDLGSEISSWEDEIVGDYIVHEAAQLLDGKSPQNIESKVSFTTKYIASNTIPKIIAKAKINIQFKHVPVLS